MSNSGDKMRKLMESLDVYDTPVEEELKKYTVGEPDPMTGEPEEMPDDVLVFDWKASPEQVLEELEKELEPLGIKFVLYDDGSDQVIVSIKRVDY